MGSTQSLDMAFAMLERWRHNLPTVLSLSREGLSQDPACCLLHMKHNQLLILATRSWLLNAVKERLETTGDAQSPPSLLKVCMAAARHNIRLGRHLLLITEPRKLLHIGLQPLLDAALCVVLQELVYGNNLSSDEAATGNRMIDFVVDVFDQEARLGNHYGRDGARALRQLRVLVMHMSPSYSSSDILRAIDTPDLFGMGGGSAPGQPLPEAGQGSFLYNDLMTAIEDDWQIGH